jgi:hypothetical protein
LAGVELEGLVRHCDGSLGDEWHNKLAVTRQGRSNKSFMCESQEERQQLGDEVLGVSQGDGRLQIRSV